MLVSGHAVAAQNGIQPHIGKPAFVKHPLPQRALAAHAAFFHHPAGRGIIQLVLGLDAVQLGLQRGSRLRVGSVLLAGGDEGGDAALQPGVLADG